MIRALLDLPSYLRSRLAGALRSGLLGIPCSLVSLRSVLGLREGGEKIAGSLGELERKGISGPASAELIRILELATSRSRMPDLVWSGPEVPGLHARDTRRVYEELLGSAELSVWASSYAYFDGPRAFEVLARRMDEKPDLRVTLLLRSLCGDSLTASGGPIGRESRGRSSTMIPDLSMWRVLVESSMPKRL